MKELNFSVDDYHRLVQAGLESGYRFLPFDAAVSNTAEPVCLLRHDIDADVEAALRMANIEAAAGVRATYFFMLRSPIYNLFARENWRMACEIIALGHHAGLHFDGGFDAGDHFGPAGWIALEAEFLSRGLNTPINVVSFHQPSQEVLDEKIDTGRLINTYSKRHLVGFHYLSDSNRQWHAQNPLEIFRARSIDRLHLLIHPMWWMHGDKQRTSDVWNAVILGNLERSQKQLLETERAYGAKRRFVLDGGADG